MSHYGSDMLIKIQHFVSNKSGKLLVFRLFLDYRRYTGISYGV